MFEIRISSWAMSTIYHQLGCVCIWFGNGKTLWRRMGHSHNAAFELAICITQSTIHWNDWCFNDVNKFFKSWWLQWRNWCNRTSLSRFYWVVINLDFVDWQPQWLDGILTSTYYMVVYEHPYNTFLRFKKFRYEKIKFLKDDLVIKSWYTHTFYIFKSNRSNPHHTILIETSFSIKRTLKNRI